MVKNKFIVALDPKINRRTTYVIKGTLAISLVTGHKFRLTENKIKELIKND